MTNAQRGRDFEDFIADLMRLINDYQDRGFEVVSRSPIKDYEIDVVLKKEMLELDLFSINKTLEHYILIECKYWSRAVDRDVIITVDGKVKRIPGSSAIVIAKSGFQSGAIEEAQRCGIILMNAEQLPDLFTGIKLALAGKIKNKLFIRKNQRAEPFFCLIDGDEDNTFSGIRGVVSDRRRLAPLFLSKTHAQNFINNFSESQKLQGVEIAGLSQEQLRQFFVITSVLGDGFFLSLSNPDGKVINTLFDRNMIVRDFYYVGNPEEIISTIDSLLKGK